MPRAPREKKHFCVWVKPDGKLCGMAFVTPIARELHIRVHKGEKPEICQELTKNGEICGKGFAQPSALTAHINGPAHKNIKNNVCHYVFVEGETRVGEECGARFNKKQGLDEHTQHHTGLYTCFCDHHNDDGRLCKKGTTTAKLMVSHVMTNHTDKN